MAVRVIRVLSVLRVTSIAHDASLTLGWFRVRSSLFGDNLGKSYI